VWRGDKTYEIRTTADRAFKVGDRVVLREYLPLSKVYGPRSILGLVTYVTLPGEWGLPPDLCVFSFRMLARRDVAS
jgi:hypothetical protein